MERRKQTLTRGIVTLLVGGLVVLAAGVVPGCAGCKGKAPLNYVAADAVVVLVVPSIGEALRDTKALLDKFRDQAVVKLGLDQGKAQILKELGFDPEKPETLRAKGINPEGGLVASLAADGKSGSIVIATEDPKVAEKTLRELATKMMGGSATFQEKDFAGVKVTLLVAQGQETTPRAAWTHINQHVILCGMAKDGKLGEHVAQIAKLEANIKSNKTFTTLQGKVGKHQVLVYADGPAVKKMLAAKAEEQLKSASEWMKKYVKEQQEQQEQFLAYYLGGGLALRVSAEGITLRGYTAMPAEKGKAIREIFKGTGATADFGHYLGADALAVWRFSINGKKLIDRLMEIVPARSKRGFYGAMEQVERETKMGFEKDILPIFSGRFAGGVFAPAADAIKAGPPRSMSQAIRLVQAVGLAQITDAAKAAELLTKLERLLVMARVDVKVRTEGDRKVYSVDDDGKPLLAWTAVKDVIIVATGERLAKTTTLVTKGGDHVLSQIDSSRAKGLMKSDDGIVLYYSVAKTADMIRGLDLPAELKAIISTGLSTVAKFSDVTLAWEVEDEGMLGELSVRVK